MQIPADIILHDTLRKWSVWLVFSAVFIAVLAVIGWEYDLQSLKDWGQAHANINPLSATLFILTGCAFICLIQPGGKRPFCTIGYSFAGIVIAISLYKLGAAGIGSPSNIDLLFFRSKMLAEGGMPYRMSNNSSFCFLLLNVSLVTLPYRHGHRLRISHLALIPVLLISLFSFLSYLYRTSSLEHPIYFIPMALHTAICFFLLSLSILFATPDMGFMKDITSKLTGSSIARVLVPAAIIVPALLGFLRLWGSRQNFYTNDFGIALLTISTIVVFFAIVWYNTVIMNRRDLAQMKASQALNDSEEQVKAIFSNAPDAIVLIDEQETIVRWNPEAEHLFGWSSNEVTGQQLSNVIIPSKFRETHKKGLQRFITKGHSHMIGRSIEIWANRKNETQMDISLTISPLVLQGKQFYIGFMRNITEKKRNEARLKTFNEELTKQVKDKTREVVDIFERVTDGFIALDKNFRYTYMNKRAGQMTHVDPVDMIGKNVWDVFPAAVGSPTFEAFNRAMKTQTYVTNVDHFEALSLWQENHIYPSPNGLSIFIRDISEQKHAEKNITEARNLADTLVDSLPGIFYFYDAEGKFLRWNKQFEEVSGYTGEEISNMHPLQFFNAADHAYMTSRIQETFQSGESSAEANFVTRRGEEVPYFFRAALINYEGRNCLLGTGIDIKERKKAEANLKASEQKYKLLFENNPMPMYMVIEGTFIVVDVNAAALKQYGYSRPEFMALNAAKLLHPDEISRMKSDTQHPEFHDQQYRGIWKHLRKDGSTVLTEVTTHDVFYQNKAVRLVLANNVTEQQIAKEKLEESYDSIRKLTEYLQNIREEERLHISREIHDELGQLLTVLKMDVSWLNKKIDAPEGPIRAKITELLGLIDTTVKTVRRIASELRPTLLDDLGIQAAMEWHLEEFERRSGIHQNFDPPGREVSVDDSQKIGLFRIFQESLTNVARHSGGKNVNVSLKEDDNLVILTIQDDGKGFDEESTRKNTLGLLGMKERTKVMGGEYTIQSEPGNGTTVKVVVPTVRQKTIVS